MDTYSEYLLSEGRSHKMIEVGESMQDSSEDSFHTDSSSDEEEFDFDT